MNTETAIAPAPHDPRDPDLGRQCDAQHDVGRRHQDGRNHLEPHDLSSVKKHCERSPDRTERGPDADGKDESERRLN